MVRNHFFLHDSQHARTHTLEHFGAQGRVGGGFDDGLGRVGLGFLVVVDVGDVAGAAFLTLPHSSRAVTRMIHKERKRDT